jgi:RimJ/RimL family protein N-acetyltransferase
MARSLRPIEAAIVCETERLRLRCLCEGDAAFILELLNDADFLRYIGDRQVRTEEDAVRYIRGGPAVSYERYGFGLWRVELMEDSAPVGICGLLKRDALPDVDIGFATLPRFRSRGYTLESAEAVMRWGRERLGLRRIVAITAPDNHASMGVLGKLGFLFERMIRLPGEARDCCLFGSTGHSTR